MKKRVAQFLERGHRYLKFTREQFDFKSYIGHKLIDTIPYGIFGDLRSAILRKAGFCNIASNVWFHGTPTLRVGRKFASYLEIGEATSINTPCIWDINGRITIGKRVGIGPNSFFITGTHEIGSKEERRGETIASDITIGDGVWIAANVTILPGVTIGDGSIITAGSVLSMDIPAGVVAGGNPARVIRYIDKDNHSLTNIVLDSTPNALQSVEYPEFKKLDQIDSKLVAQIQNLAAKCFEMNEAPELEAGPNDIPLWDSFGQLRLATSIEDGFGIRLTGKDMEYATTIGRVVQIVDHYNNMSACGMKTSTYELPLVAHYALFNQAKVNLQKTAVICNGKEHTYGELMSHIDELGRALIAANVKKQDIVMFLVDDKYEFIALLYAIWVVGAVAIPMIAEAAPESIQELAELSGARIFLTTASEKTRFYNFNFSFVMLFLDDISFQHGLPTIPDISVKPSDTAQIMFTSGTTSRRKAVVLTHRNIMQSSVNINQFMKVNENIREYITIPVTHSFGLGRVRSILSLGGTLVLNNGFLSPRKAIDAIVDYECNSISWVPAGFAMFENFEDDLRTLGKQISHMELGSAAMPIEQKEKLIRLFPNARICMHYGLTEASRSAFIEFHSEKDKLHTVGRPSPNVVLSIRDEDGKELPPGNEGEIVVAGGHVTPGYLNDDALNSKTRFSTELFRTGDFGMLDKDGYLVLLGRKDDMINSGGSKISPIEVEAKIRDIYPDLDFCVLGVVTTNALLGEIPVLAYVPQKGEEITRELLATKLTNKLDRNKFPKAVLAFNSLPKTQNGKVQRNKLKSKIGKLKID